MRTRRLIAIIAAEFAATMTRGLVAGGRFAAPATTTKPTKI